MSEKLQVSLVKFNKGAFITIENKSNSSSFYIIKEGRVKITREFKLDDDESDPLIREGSFIGIISCMSGHPREETSRTVSDLTIAIKIQKDQFYNLIKKNPHISMKIIRSFSSKLRYIDEKMMIKNNQKIQNLSTNKEEAEKLEEERFYEMASFYKKNQDYYKSYYIFHRYLENFPQGAYVEEARQSLQSLTKVSKDALNKNDFILNDSNEDKKANNLTYKEYKNNTLIFCEHEIGKELFIIQEGQVKITKIINNYEKIIAILKPGDIFGEMALLENQKRSANAIAYGDVKVLIVNQENYESMVINQPLLSIKMISILSERLWTGFRQLQNKSIKDITTRLLDGLILNLEKEKINVSKIPYTFNFGMKELFKMLDIDPEEGKTSFSDIIKNKILKISKDGKKIICQNLEDLRKEWIFEKNKQSRLQQKLLNSKKLKSSQDNLNIKKTVKSNNNLT